MTVVQRPVLSPVEVLTFEGLYRDLQRPLARFVLNSVHDAQDAEDICQEVWTRVDAGLHELREPAAARTWVYRIARHAIIDAVRRRSRRPESVPLSIEPPAPDVDDPAVAALSKERAALAWQTLAMLPTRQRMALYLKEVEEQRYSDIAAVLNCSESAVETLLFRARRNFAERFGAVAENRAERCARARDVMAALLDGEGDAVLRRGVEAHLDECGNCAQSLPEAQEMTRLRGALLLPPLALTPEVALGSGLPELGSLALDALRSVGAKVLAFALGGKATVTAGAAATATVAALALTPVLPANTTDGFATTPPSDVASVQPRLPESPIGVRVDEAVPEVMFQRAGAFSLDLAPEKGLLTILAPTVAAPFTEVVDAVPTAALALDEVATTLVNAPTRPVVSLADAAEPEASLDDVPVLGLEAADASSLRSADSVLAPLN